MIGLRVEADIYQTALAVLMAQDIFDLLGPKGNFLAGSLLDMGADPLGFLTRCAREYDGLVPLQLGLTSACLVAQLDLIEQVLRDRNIVYQKPRLSCPENLASGESVCFEGWINFCADGLLVIDPVCFEKEKNGSS